MGGGGKDGRRGQRYNGLNDGFVLLEALLGGNFSLFSSRICHCLFVGFIDVCYDPCGLECMTTCSTGYTTPANAGSQQSHDSGRFKIGHEFDRCQRIEHIASTRINVVVKRDGTKCTDRV